MRSLAEENLKRSADILTDGGKFAVLTAMVTANISSFRPDASTIVYIAVLGALFLSVGFWFYALAKKRERLRIEKQEQLSHSSRHRKHRIRIPKNTTIGVEVEE